MTRLVSIAAAAILAAVTLGLTMPAAEAQPNGAGGSCFVLSEVQSTRMQGDRILYLRAGTGAVYRMDFNADCTDVGDEPLILHPFDNNDQICRAIDLNVLVRGTGEMCNPVSLRRLTPAEIAAIPPKYRP